MEYEFGGEESNSSQWTSCENKVKATTSKIAKPNDFKGHWFLLSQRLIQEDL